MAFAGEPLIYLRGRERDRAVLSLDRYLGHMTGAAFERTADPSLFHRITEKDLVAVTMLGGSVPPATALWLLGPGAPDLTALLVQVPRTERALWDPAVPLGPHSPLAELARIIGRRAGMGPAKTSRLLAAKRPNLVPLADRRVRRALALDRERALDPRPWRALFHDPDVRAEVADIRAAVPAGAGLSLLRVVHIVIWMREGGWAGPEDDPFPALGRRRSRR